MTFVSYNKINSGGEPSVPPLLFPKWTCELEDKQSSYPTREGRTFFFGGEFFLVLCQYISIIVLICKVMSGILFTKEMHSIAMSVPHLKYLFIQKQFIELFHVQLYVWKYTVCAAWSRQESSADSRHVATVGNIWGEGHGDKDWSIDKERKSLRRPN